MEASVTRAADTAMRLEELMTEVNQLGESDLDQLLHQVAVLRARRKAVLLPEEEAQLLLKINQGVPSEIRKEYQALCEKRDAETISDTEYDMLVDLSHQIEQLGAKRLEAMAQLAQLRQVSLSDLMTLLGIQPVTYV
jgi:hypothetical protein